VDGCCSTERGASLGPSSRGAIRAVSTRASWRHRVAVLGQAARGIGARLHRGAQWGNACNTGGLNSGTSALSWSSAWVGCGCRARSSLGRTGGTQVVSLCARRGVVVALRVRVAALRTSTRSVGDFADRTPALCVSRCGRALCVSRYGRTVRQPACGALGARRDGSSVRMDSDSRQLGASWPSSRGAQAIVLTLSASLRRGSASRWTSGALLTRGTQAAVCIGARRLGVVVGFGASVLFGRRVRGRLLVRYWGGVGVVMRCRLWGRVLMGVSCVLLRGTRRIGASG
jgi:hypothetical protein